MFGWGLIKKRSQSEKREKGAMTEFSGGAATKGGRSEGQV